MASADADDSCLNCAEPLGGRAYCGACGQRGLHKRLRWRDLARDLTQHFLDWDLPWPRTVVDLTLAPGQTALAYLEGRRTRYVNPVKYAFYALLISTLFSGAVMQDLVSPQLGGWRRVLATNLPLFMLLMSPVAIIALRVAFWRTHHNLVEIAVFVLYMVGQVSLLFTLLGAIGAAVPSTWWAVVPALLATAPPIYLLYASARFFDARLDHAIIASLLALTATLWAAGQLWLRIAGG